MKKIINLSVLSIFVISSLIISSCTNDEDSDVIKPIINLIEPCQDDTLKIGDEVHFEAEFSDDVMLSSYMIEIHSNFNDHNHSSLTKSEEDNIAFSYKKSFDISGKKNSYEHHHDIFVPENTIAGKYHLMIYCTDAAGNESYVARNIVLSEKVENHHTHD